MSKYYLDYTGFSGTNRRKLDLGGKLALVGLSGLALGGALRGIPKLKEHYKIKKAYKDYVKSVGDSGDELLDKENFKSFKKAVRNLKMPSNISNIKSEVPQVPLDIVPDRRGILSIGQSDAARDILYRNGLELNKSINKPKEEFNRLIRNSYPKSVRH